MNIGITTLVNPAESNGLGHYVKFLIEGLQEANIDHDFFIFLNKEIEEFIDIEHPRFSKIFINIPHYPRSLMRPIYFIWQNTMAGKLLRKYKIDVFHLPNPIPLFNTFNIPHVVTIHDIAEVHSLRHTVLKRKFRIFTNKISEKKSSTILTVSEFSKSEISKYMGVEKDNIFVTHLGPSIDSNRSFDNSILQKEPYFLHVGGAHLNKNIDRIIHAFLSSSCKDKMSLYFVGQTKHLKKSLAQLNRLKEKGIYFTGYLEQEELRNFYVGATALIYPSLYEGFGLPILEAMSLGVPVITSNRASMPEVAGDAALYINPEDEISIRKAMEKIMKEKNMRISLIQRGLERSKKFEWRDTAQKTIHAYETAANLR